MPADPYTEENLSIKSDKKMLEEVFNTHSNLVKAVPASKQVHTYDRLQNEPLSG